MMDQRNSFKSEKPTRWSIRQNQAIKLHRYKKTILRQRMFSPIWTLLICSVVALTIVNVIISLKLTYLGNPKDSNGNPNESSQHYVQEEVDASLWYPSATTVSATINEADGTLDVMTDCLTFGLTGDRRTNGFRYVNNTGRFDNSRKYLIHDFVQMADQWPAPALQLVNTPGSVCLATQASVDHLHWLPEVSNHWQGPISVAVFVPGEEFHIAIRFIYHLRHCFVSVREHVSFHLLYPRKHPPRYLPALRGNLSLSCLNLEHTLKIMLNLRPRTLHTWRGALLYPQNHLRNVARKACPTSHVFLTDVDIIPRPELAASLCHFLRHPTCDRCAFVIPTYEVDDKVPLPINKTELVNLVRKRKAQPFHNVIFINNQFATNSSKWEKLQEEENDLSVAYPVTNFELYYEPFYLSTDDVPSHDERFIGYGYTRNTQVYEMYVAGYKFFVLNSAFAMHRGLKLKKTKNSWREKQNRANSRQFKKFEREILAKHGYNKKT